MCLFLWYAMLFIEFTGTHTLRLFVGLGNSERHKNTLQRFTLYCLHGKLPLIIDPSKLAVLDTLNNIAFWPLCTEFHTKSEFSFTVFRSNFVNSHCDRDTHNLYSKNFGGNSFVELSRAMNITLLKNHRKKMPTFLLPFTPNILSVRMNFLAIITGLGRNVRCHEYLIRRVNSMNNI